MTASTLAIALTAPFTGAVADVLGRKRVITAAMFAVLLPMARVGAGADVQALIVWRFVQGLLLPPIFAVTVAYIGDEWPAHEVAGVAGIYIAGSSLGGFCGRFMPGVLADLVGWRGAFLALAALSLAGAIWWRSCCRASALRALGGPRAPRRGRCCGICATRSCSPPMRSASACCSTSSRSSPM